MCPPTCVKFSWNPCISLKTKQNRPLGFLLCTHSILAITTWLLEQWLCYIVFVSMSGHLIGPPLRAGTWFCLFILSAWHNYSSANACWVNAQQLNLTYSSGRSSIVSLLWPLICVLGILLVYSVFNELCLLIYSALQMCGIILV